MCTEIEAKLKVDSLDPVRNRLTELGAEFAGQQSQTDYYLDDAENMLAGSDRCLRLRRQRSDNSETFYLTYKGAKEKDHFKKRQEIEIQVDDLELTEKLLSELGYERALVLEKRRRVWRLRDCIVALDELPLLGSFVEIEGPSDDKITDVQANLGLVNLKHIAESYALLIRDKLDQLGREEKEVLFKGA
ncbi:MAG: class IV adenylate cyclase [Phycisphaerales bacterium]|nr:MAG: class IV adenylate cyclase [Phycisphaerales bacterium]